MAPTIAVTVLKHIVRFNDTSMFIYFQESDCISNKIISESYFADIPLPKLDGPDKFICHKPIAGKNNDNHQVVSGRSNVVKKDTNIKIFSFYLGYQKIKIFISLLMYEEIINSSRNKNILEKSKNKPPALVSTVERIANTVSRLEQSDEAMDVLMDLEAIE
jgi:hypothetical protein